MNLSRLDYGGWIGRVRLTPAPAADAKELDKMLSKVSYVTLGPAVDAEGVRARERTVVEFVQETAERARTGDVEFNLLGPEHALD